MMDRQDISQFDESASSSEEDNIENEVDELSQESSEDEDISVLTTPSRQKGKGRVVGNQSSNLIVQTSFDSYFTYSSTRAQTSGSVFSQLVPPLSSVEYSEAISTCGGIQSITPSILSNSSLPEIFSRFIFELNEGFNLLCYGFGSKRRVLNKFAMDYCAKHGHVIVVNSFISEFSFKDLLNSIETLPGIQSVELSSSTSDKRVQRIYDFFNNSEQKRDLYIVIHNIDAPGLRTTKSKSFLSLLAINPHIHIIASVDHINAPLLWPFSESATRKPYAADEDSIPSRGFSWLWHDLTTLASYDFELAFADKSSITGAHGGGAKRKAEALGAEAATIMSETAALHLLASVTQKAQKLFALLGTKQLESIEETGGDAAANDLQQFGMGYDILFNAARDNFIATNDTALRSVLGEFRDHGLVLSAAAGSGGGHVLWIPLRKERLANVLQSLKAE